MLTGAENGEATPADPYTRSGYLFADCSYKDLLEVPVGLPSNVFAVSLAGNKIKVLKSKSFINITQVTALWLEDNEIVTIERGTLAPLTQLFNMDISHNKIVNFPWEDLVNLTALRTLKMNNNEMVNLPMDCLSKCTAGSWWSCGAGPECQTLPLLKIKLILLSNREVKNP
uniref:Uncharacterized protein n=1 Tax=Salarias fasciatus TaxID=181472 RepID=A0A672J448_SALFA